MWYRKLPKIELWRERIAFRNGREITDKTNTIKIFWKNVEIKKEIWKQTEDGQRERDKQTRKEDKSRKSDMNRLKIKTNYYRKLKWY